MQKMHIAINPKIYEQKYVNSHRDTIIELSLVGSSLGGVDSLTRLLAAIENNILIDFKWTKVGELTENSAIINKYEKIKNFKQPLNISYQVASLVEGEHLTHLKNSYITRSGCQIVCL